MLSINGTYRCGGGNASAKVRPFLTGGYTLGWSGGDSESLFNVGGGVDDWLKPKVGLRVEFRAHVWTSEGDTTQFWGVTFGVTFRSAPAGGPPPKPTTRTRPWQVPCCRSRSC